MQLLVALHNADAQLLQSQLSKISTEIWKSLCYCGIIHTSHQYGSVQFNLIILKQKATGIQF